MLPIAPLMIEHRLIERMITVIRKEIGRIENGGEIDPGFIDDAVDFIRTYADRCHHGKEEDILFRDLGRKELTSYDRIMVEELKEDHRKGRENTALLVAAKERFIKGDKDQSGKILDEMKFFVDFYPKHIEKEDKHFFMPSMSLFTEDEKDAMMREEVAFDEHLIHVIYKEKVLAAEKSRQ
jgi:hemerythrin-like domain-containing protein